MSALRDRFTAVAALLAVSVTVEVLLFRIFARGGVYFIEDGTSQVVKSGYTSLVFLGNVFFNFAAPMVLVLLAFAAIKIWRRGDHPLERAMAIAVAGIAGLGALRLVGLDATPMSLLYLVVSACVVLIALAAAAKANTGLPVRAFLALTGLSYLLVYAFKVGSGFAGSGWSPPFAMTTLHSLGEWLAVAGFLAMAPLLRHVADRRALVAGTVVAVLAMGMAFGRAESIPLIATWAFGLTLNLPYPAYVAVLWVTTMFVVGSFRQGMPLMGVGLLLLLLGHRTIPLTYFNDLALAGMALVVLSTPLRLQEQWIPSRLLSPGRAAKDAASA